MSVTPASALTTTVLPLADDLARFGDAPALLTPSEAMTYSVLAERVDAVAARLGTERKLVLLEAANRVETVVTLFAALRGRHPVLVVPSKGADDRFTALVAGYDPDVVASADGGLIVRRTSSIHRLHPDLALLLSTSGSTGSPKLVRLSHTNLQSNAEAIATYLGITDADRAITSLPLSYCYGLSVLTSHLLCGAAVVVTDLSVVDRCFWDLVRRSEVTNLAGVPHTFDLLERAGFDAMELPSLRFITQAGGRLAPERVSQLAALGLRQGWDLFVMYGQTEATARMAYLPPELALTHPGAIGVPIPGGTIAIDQPDGDGVGELVYRGPNVMMGYAESPIDLAAGRTVDALRTGDLGRHNDAGLLEVVSRRARFVKPFGLRVDLDHVERLLAATGIDAAATGDDERLLLVAVGTDGDRVRGVLSDEIGLPATAIRVVSVEALPRVPSGKVDRQAVAALVGPPAADDAGSGTAGRSVHDILRRAVGCDQVENDDSFVSLGGDSLSYVEVSIRLEEALGSLPADWHLLSVGALVRSAATEVRSRRLPRVETTVVLRAAAIVLIVCTHADLFRVQGGAHVLLGVAGFNFARFHLSATGGLGVRRLLESIGRVALPSMAFIGALALVTGDYSLNNVLLVNDILGPTAWHEHWRYWYIEVLVQLLLGLTAVLAIPRVRTLERAHRFSFPVALAGGGLLLRAVIDADPITRMLTPQSLVWLFALGWAAAQASTTRQRLLVSGALALTVPGSFNDPARDALILGGLLLLIWVRSLPLPALLARSAGAVAAASLAIYLTHWPVLPLLEDATVPAVAAGAALAVGVAAWTASRALLATGRSLLRAT